MAEIVLSVLFEKLGSAALEKLARYKEITDQSMKRCLAYDIDDILDDMKPKLCASCVTEQSDAITRKVRKLIPTCCTNILLSTGVQNRLDKFSTKLQDLVEEKAILGSSVKSERSKRMNRRLQTSMLHATSIVGRQGEKEALVHKLLSVANEPYDKNFSAVPIVGMGGVGKTTLARLLYDDDQVKDHFQLKAWVCISDDFDSYNISKVFFQSVTSENKDFADLNLLQVAIRDQLRDKRFLIVLDDVWSES